MASVVGAHRPSGRFGVPAHRGKIVSDAAGANRVGTPPGRGAPSERVNEHGLREAHTNPLVAFRLDNGELRSWRLPAEKAWRTDDPFDEIEWPRTGTSFAAVVLDCDTRRSIELAQRAP